MSKSDNTKMFTYVYFDPESNLPFYVGKGNGRRDVSHLNGTHNKRLSRKIQEIRNRGKTPNIVRVLENVNNEDAIKMEIELIAKWGRLGLDENGILMNYTLGGEGALGRIRSKESIEKGASKQRGIPRPHSRKAVSVATKAAMNTPEMRAHISAKRKGVPCPDETKRKLSEFFKVARKGAGNPAAKTWTVIAPDGAITVTKDLVALCEHYAISYVGLKSSYRANRPVQAGKSKGWQLFLKQQD